MDFTNDYGTTTKTSESVDIHRIINEAMEKKDRYVTIFISDKATSVNVYPTGDEPRWIRVEHMTDIPDYCRFEYRCSECGFEANHPDVYCSHCGEKMHGVKKDVDVVKIVKKEIIDEPNNSQWISVKDRLPDDCTEVVCYHHYEPASPNVVAQNYHYKGGRFMSDTDKVTHWMPLPDAPEV